MSEEQNKKSPRILDKIIMGAVIGGAIGSVIGASIKKKNAQNKQNNDEEVKGKGLFWAIKTYFKRRKLRKLAKQESSLRRIPTEKL